MRFLFPKSFPRILSSKSASHSLLPFITLSCLLFSCQPQREAADLVVYNGVVYTVDSAFSRVGAFAVRDGRILATGPSEDIREAYAAAVEVDADGKTVVPGLIDAHCHFYRMGLGLETVDLVGTGSFEEVLERLVAFNAKHAPAFLVGRGWDQNDWAVKEFPDKRALDSLFPDIPVALTRIDGHALLANQKALDLGGVTPQTLVAGGEVVLEDGKLTGVLIDTPMDLIWAKWPAPDLAARIRALHAAEAISFEYGLTTVNDAGLGRGTIELIDSLQQAGELAIRVYAMVSNTPENLDYYLSGSPYKTERLNVRSVKVYGDGALGSRGAALKIPYADQPGHFGAMITPAAELESLALRISAAGFQMNTHAIGDSANSVVLKAYRKALASQQDPRWKVEHAQVVDTAELAWFGRKIIPSVQPTHATSDMYWAEDRLGPDRMHRAYAFQKLLAASGTVALGTDFPVEQVNPMLTFYAAVARQDLDGYPENGFRMEDALTREAALRGMTIWAAYSNFEESEKGSLEPGKYADFTILDGDLMELPDEKLKDIRVLQTYVSGVKVYD